MKRFAKKLTAGILCVAVIVLTACSGNDKKGNDGKESEKGRYIETGYTLPEQVENVIAMGKMEEDTLRLVSTTGVFDSKDGGQTWEQAMNGYVPTIERDDGAYLMDAAVDASGRLFLAYTGGYYLIDESGTEKPVTIDVPEGDQEEFTINADEEEEDAGEDAEITDSDEAGYTFENTLINVKFTGDGRLAGVDYNGTGYLVDPDSGKILQSYGAESESYIESFAIVGNRLIALGFEGLDIYNIETGALEEMDPALSEYFKDSGNTAEGGSIQSQSRIVAAADAEDTIYYVDSTGLYRYTFGAGEMERLINGSLCSMSNPALTMSELFETENNTFLMYYQGDQGISLMHYEYSEEASAVPSHEIKVYALNDNQAIRQAISNFQTKNPDYYINLEIGMSGEDSITASDALSTLNTNILAGNGPDLILLDQMPVDSYIEKGLLEDLADVVEECKKDSTFFENILNYKQTKDGVYVIPTRFALPVVAGTDETIKNVTDLSSLRTEIQRLRSENPDVASILGPDNAEALLGKLLNTSLVKIVKEDGTLDKDGLTEFLSAAKEIYDSNYQPDEDAENYYMSVNGMDSNVLLNMPTVLSKGQKMNIGKLDGVWALGSLVSMNDEVDWSYNVLAGLSQNVFIPQDTIGISAKSEEKDAARKFLKYLLSGENQSSIQPSGFPVNADALEQAYESVKGQEKSSIAFSTASEESGGVSSDIQTMTLRSANEDEFRAVKDYIAAADTAAVTDTVITEAIVAEGGTCLTEGSDINDAVDKILQSVNLYLAE